MVPIVSNIGPVVWVHVMSAVRKIPRANTLDVLDMYVEVYMQSAITITVTVLYMHVLGLNCDLV